MKYLIAFFLSFLVAAPALADAPHVSVRLVPETLAVAPGGRLTVAVEQAIAPGWHTYWKNPGEAGLATSIDWNLPPGWKAGPIGWPYPSPKPVGPLMDYGYEGKVWLLAELTVPPYVKPGRKVEIAADVAWLACREVCVPEQAHLSTTVFVEVDPAPPDALSAERFAAAKALLPVVSPWTMRYVADKGLRLIVEAAALSGAGQPSQARFFPARRNLIQDSAPQGLRFFDGGIVLDLAPGTALKTGDTLDGVLVLQSHDGSKQALEVHAPPGVAPPMTDKTPLGLLAALLLAFAGGVILNIMPCVLPVLAMKAMALANSGAERGRARAEALAYSLGAVGSFVAFGLVLAGLRAGGAAIGWGFQLQEPAVVAALALLLFAVGLNFLGLFELAPISAGDSLTRKPGRLGAFFTGVLAVAVAAPCTAPFMASAIGFGLTQGPAVILAVFAALGLGFALPFLAIGLFPPLQRLLPKPGPWMVRFKQWLAVPMFAAAAWLYWVLAGQVSRDGLILALVALIVVGIGLRGIEVSRDYSPLRRRIGMALAVLGIAAALVSLVFLRPAVMTVREAGLPEFAETYSPARLKTLRAEGRAVFVDATASWCITCLVNEEAVLSRPEIRAAFAKRKIAYLIADWTNRDPAITKLLEENDRSGVPLYLYYAPGAARPAILPQILTPAVVREAIGAKAE